MRHSKGPIAMIRLFSRAAAASLALALACGLAMAAPEARAQSLEIIALKQRPADQVIGQVQALVGSRGSVTGSGFSLFVRTDPATLGEVRRLLAVLDARARQLLISVRQVDAGRRSDVRIEGAAVVSQRGARIVSSADARDANDNADVTQRVQVLEGGSAWISSGESRLEPQIVGVGRNGPVVAAVPTDARSGFAVVPRVNGDRVFLDVNRQQGSFGARGEINTSQLVTQVQGRLGEWIALGGLDSVQRGSTLGTGGYSSADADQRSRMEIKVEELAP
ncbi:secretin N-terminal domain-containing protein [soil metagenome]